MKTLPLNKEEKNDIRSRERTPEGLKGARTLFWAPQGSGRCDNGLLSLQGAPRIQAERACRCLGGAQQRSHRAGEADSPVTKGVRKDEKPRVRPGLLVMLLGATGRLRSPRSPLAGLRPLCFNPRSRGLTGGRSHTGCGCPWTSLPPVAEWAAWFSCAATRLPRRPRGRPQGRGREGWLGARAGE